jgi:hypothetical protein
MDEMRKYITEMPGLITIHFDGSITNQRDTPTELDVKEITNKMKNVSVEQHIK